MDRDLRECQAKGLRADWSFAIAYNAALQAATAALAAAGYRASRDAHHYRVFQSLEYTIKADPIGWPAWKRELVHELLHEYQYKVVAGNASVMGKALEKKHCHCFDGPGHDAHFFTAIAEKASYFGMSPETLIMNL